MDALPSPVPTALRERGRLLDVPALVADHVFGGHGNPDGMHLGMVRARVGRGGLRRPAATTTGRQGP
jgi:hypothetical protein